MRKEIKCKSKEDAYKVIDSIDPHDIGGWDIKGNEVTIKLMDGYNASAKAMSNVFDGNCDSCPIYERCKLGVPCVRTWEKFLTEEGADD